MKKKIFFILALVCASFTAQAQAQKGEQRLVSEAYDEFNPHWFMQLQGGAAYSVGETKFSNTISPAAQVAVGYKFSKLFSARFAVNGWQGKNRYCYADIDYKWNFIQPNVDVMLDLSTLFAGWKANRVFNPYLFLGAGAPICFNNDDAVDAVRNSHFDGFEKLWDGTKVMWAARGGIGADFRVSKRVAIGLEINANMYPDKFNSKKGNHDNLDWQINGLVGIKITLGKSTRHHDAVYEYIPAPEPEKVKEPEPQPAPQPAPEPVVEKVKPQPISAYIYFRIGRSVIRPTEYPELDKLTDYLKEYPETRVILTGYADKDTGTSRINERLSKERAAVVKAYLIDKGIAADRISTEAKGDTVQPFDSPQKNRVTIAVTE